VLYLVKHRENFAFNFKNKYQNFKCLGPDFRSHFNTEFDNLINY
jgi:hypothetical protein